MEQVAPSPSGCAPAQHACSTYRLDSRTWRLEECASSSSFHVGEMESSGTDSFAMYSYDVDLVSRSRPGEIVATLDLGDEDAIEQVEHVRRDLALVVLPCEVDGERRRCSDDARHWALYRWTPAPRAEWPDETESTLELVTSNLPRGARVSPRGDRVAWMQGEELCMRWLSSGEPRCIAPPHE